MQSKSNENLWISERIRAAKNAVSMRPEASTAYTASFSATHRRLFELLGIHALQAPAPSRPKIFHGASIGYGHVQMLFDQAKMPLPEEHNFGYEKELDTELDVRLDQIDDALKSGTKAPNPFLDLFLLGEVKVQLPEFYETGMEFAARSVRHPQSAFRGVIEGGSGTLLTEIVNSSASSEGNFLIDTRVADDAHSFLSGYSEVVIHMRDLSNARMLEAQFQD